MTNFPELRRDRADAKVAGVCASLARAWGIDPLLVRIGFVVATLLTQGFGVAAYIALWALIPERGRQGEPIRELLPFTRAWTSQQLTLAVIAAALIGGLVVVGAGPGAALIAVLVLVILRSALKSQQRAPQAPLPYAEPRTEFEHLAQAWAMRLDDVRSGRASSRAPAPLPLAAASDPDAALRASRRHGVRTWFGIAVGLGLTWTGLGVLQSTGVPVGPLAWSSATLAVLALALIVVARPTRARHGRPPALLAAALVTAAITGATALPTPSVIVGTRVPQHAVAPVAYTAASLPDALHLGMGARALDLSGVAIERDRTVKVALDIGSLAVTLPPTGNLVVHYAVDMGSATVANGRVSGVDVTSTWQRVTDPAAPTLTLDLSVDVGSLEVSG